jgi:hypothetical protein
MESAIFHLRESLKRERGYRDLLKYAELTLRVGYLDDHAEYLLTGLEIYEKQGGWIFDERDAMDALLRNFHHFEGGFFEEDRWTHGKARCLGLMKRAVARALDGLKEHGRGVVAFVTGESWTYRLYHILRAIKIGWEEDSYFFQNVLDLLQGDLVSPEEQDDIAGEVMVELRQTLRFSQPDKLIDVYRAIKDKQISGEYAERLPEIIEGYRKKIAVITDPT